MTDENRQFTDINKITTYEFNSGQYGNKENGTDEKP